MASVFSVYFDLFVFVFFLFEILVVLLFFIIFCFMFILHACVHVYVFHVSIYFFYLTRSFFSFDLIIFHSCFFLEIFLDVNPGISLSSFYCTGVVATQGLAILAVWMKQMNEYFVDSHSVLGFSLQYLFAACIVPVVYG